MDPAVLAQYTSGVVDYAVQIGGRLLGAVLLWFIGGIVVRSLVSQIDKRLAATRMDATVRNYAQNISTVLLKALLVIAILSILGIETTTFAAVFAAVGLAIGTAWGGLLANFAAGFFMVVLRPFKVGDFVEAGGQIGTVEEIGLFVTTITTMDHVTTIVGNNTIFSGTIKNFSNLEYRRVDCVAQLAHTVDPREAIEALKMKLSQIPNVQQEPAPDVHILEFNLAGPVLCVRPYCHTDHYWQVYFDTNMLIREEFGAKGFPTPANHFEIHQAS